MRELAPDIYVAAEYKLVTVGAILTQDGWVCIDSPPFPRDALDWLTRLKAISDRPVIYLINTDHQRDRILGNMHFGATVVAHQYTAEIMNELRQSFVSVAAENMSANDNELVEIASQKLVPPQVSYTDTLYLQCGDREIMLAHKPSATPGNTWVILPDEQISFVGDSLIVDRHPYIDKACIGPWMDTLTELQDEHAGWTLVPGRGSALDDISEAEPLTEYLRMTRLKVNELLQMERSRSELNALVGELLDFFPADSGQRDEIQRRIKAILEAAYEESRLQDNDTDTYLADGMENEAG